MSENTTAKTYIFREVPIEEASAFGEKNGIFQQTEQWAAFRSFYKTSAIMGFCQEKPVLSCIVYRLGVFLTPFSIGYATRGCVCDWKNETLLQEFFTYYKEFAKKKKIVYTIFDPNADYRIEFGEPESPDPRKIMEQAGLFRNPLPPLQPSNNYRLCFHPENDPTKEEQRVYQNYTQGLKTDIQNAQTRGTTLEKYHKDNLPFAIDIFHRLLVETNEKKGFGVRDRDYYLRFAENLKDFVTLYLYKYDHKKDIALTQEAISGLESRLEAIQKELNNPETAEKRKNRILPTKRELESQLAAKQKRIQTAEKHRDDPYLSAWFFISLGNKTHYLYGANSVFLRDLKLTSTYHDMVRDSILCGAESMNMGGSLKLSTKEIKDDPMYDVYLHKQKHNGEFVEMPGEYLLVTYPKLFDLLHNKLKYFRRIIFRKK